MGCYSYTFTILFGHYYYYDVITIFTWQNVLNSFLKWLKYKMYLEYIQIIYCIALPLFLLEKRRFSFLY